MTDKHTPYKFFRRAVDWQQLLPTLESRHSIPTEVRTALEMVIRSTEDYCGTPVDRCSYCNAAKFLRSYFGINKPDDGR